MIKSFIFNDRSRKHLYCQEITTLIDQLALESGSASVEKT